MTIDRITRGDLPYIIAGLVREGVTFECAPSKHTQGTWCITLLGGY